MGFRPINDQNAISRVAFGIHLDGFTWDERRRVADGHERWREVLPRFDDKQIVTVSVGSPDPRAASPPPLEFRRYTPAGETEGALLIHNDVVAVKWGTYSTWDQVWGTARFLFDAVTDRLDEKRLIRAVELQYVDDFVTDSEPTADDFSALIDPQSKMLPPEFFEQGAFWHLHRGRFRMAHEIDAPPRQAERLLERMHLDSTQGPDQRHFVRFDDFHRFDLAQNLPARSFSARSFSNDRDDMEALFSALRAHAKRLLNEYLTTSMATRIGLRAA